MILALRRLPALLALLGAGIGVIAAVATLAVAAFLSVVPKVGALFALAQIARTLPTGVVNWPVAIGVLAVASMTYGNLAALPQTNVIRLLAYSSIAQAGYFLLGVVGVGRTDLAVKALVIFAAAYAAMNLGAFAITAQVGRDLTAFTGIGFSAPWTGGAMVAFLLSLVGVPPLAGFVGKLLLFGAAIDAGYTWLAVAGILNSVLSLAVYLRIIVPMYQPARGVSGAGLPVVVVWTIALLFTVGIGVGAQVLVGRLS